MGGGHLKKTKEFRSLNDKVEIIQYFERISHEKNSKVKTLKYFNLKALSSLNRILNNKESIMKAHTEATTTKDRNDL